MEKEFRLKGRFESRPKRKNKYWITYIKMDQFFTAQWLLYVPPA
jgi:hypothetical protein